VDIDAEGTGEIPPHECGYVCGPRFDTLPQRQVYRCTCRRFLLGEPRFAAKVGDTTTDAPEELAELLALSPIAARGVRFSVHAQRIEREPWTIYR
jgi:hypothetical protein